MITSLTNEKVKKIIKLQTTKGRREAGLFIVEGPHLVKEAKESGYLVEAFTTDDKLEGELVTEEVMKKICNTSTVVTQIGVCKILESKEICDKVLILDGIQDPGNLGTLLRSAKAFGFNSIFFSKGTVDLYNDKVIRSSQGALFRLNYHYGDKIEFIKDLSKTHKVYSTNVVNGHKPNEIEKPQRLALVLGNEGSGVSKEINDLKLTNVYIPMDDMESLNVGVAGSIIMYELAKI